MNPRTARARAAFADNYFGNPELYQPCPAEIAGPKGRIENHIAKSSHRPVLHRQSISACVTGSLSCIRLLCPTARRSPLRASADPIGIPPSSKLSWLARWPHPFIGLRLSALVRRSLLQRSRQSERTCHLSDRRRDIRCPQPRRLCCATCIFLPFSVMLRHGPRL